jgi:hypothetical protein
MVLRAKPYRKRTASTYFGDASRKYDEQIKPLYGQRET